MDYQQAQFFFNVTTTVLVSLVSIQTYLVKKHAATISSIDRVESHLDAKIKSQDTVFNHADEAIKTKIEALGNRVTALETVITKVPTHDDLSKIYREMNDLNSAFRTLAGEFKQVSQSLDRIYQAELGRK